MASIDGGEPDAELSVPNRDRSDAVVSTQSANDPPPADGSVSGSAAVCYRDGDGDGIGESSSPVSCVAGPADGGATNVATAAGDCDDADPKRAPTLTDICGDSIDNDCDGKIDDEANNACGGPCQTALAHQPGHACENGLLGACARTGVFECRNASTVCNAPTPAAGEESCDSIDNDCDGATDDGSFNECCGACNVILENKPGEACSNGQLGACKRAGVYECRGPETACNAETMKPGVESCSDDGIDNDCDGTVDDLDPKPSSVFAPGGVVCTPFPPRSISG